MGTETKDQEKARHLADACALGNRKAQFELYQQFAKAMYSTCYRLLNDSMEAEDALQEGFVSAFTHISAYKGDAPIGAWLKKIMVNQCLSRLKKRKTMMHELEAYGASSDFANPDPPDSDHTALQVEKVKQAIQLLPDGFRTVFSLYLLEGYDHKEIAQILGITETTSKTQYLRAKKKLKTLLTSL